MRKFTATRSVVMLAFGLSAMACDSATDADREALDQTNAPELGEPAGPTNTGDVGTSNTGAPAVVDTTVRPAALRAMQGSLTENGGGKPDCGLGGKGSLSAAVSVEFTALVDGKLGAKLGSVGLEADGSFKAALDTSASLVIADAVDVSGKIVGSVLVALGADLGATVQIAPITTHTSLIVKTLREALKCPCMDVTPYSTSGAAAAQGSIALAIAAALDLNVAASVGAALDLGVDVDVIVKGLANAVLAGHQARIESILKAGASLDVKVLVDAQLKALLDLQASLCASVGAGISLLDIAANLQAALDLAFQACAGISADVGVRAHVAATLALATSLDVSLGAKGGLNLGAIVFACVKGSIALEAKASVDAVVGLLKAAGAAQLTIDAAIKAGLALCAQIDAAVDLQAAIDARVGFVNALVGVNGKAGILAGFGGAIDGLFGLTVGALAGFSADLDASLAADLAAAANVNACTNVSLDVAASADVGLDLSFKGLIGTLLDFCVDLSAQASASIDVEASAHFSAEIIAKILSTAQIVARAPDCGCYYKPAP